jgi:5-methylcytosine-specific restriction endonuclease McrA
MKNYVKTYHDFFGFTPGEFVPCENCGRQSVEIHHLRPKSLDKKAENKIENLMALCRSCHDNAHKFKNINDDFKMIHRRNVLKNGNQKADIVSYNIEKI